MGIEPTSGISSASTGVITQLLRSYPNKIRVLSCVILMGKANTSSLDKTLCKYDCVINKPHVQNGIGANTVLRELVLLPFIMLK